MTFEEHSFCLFFQVLIADGLISLVYLENILVSKAGATIKIDRQLSVMKILEGHTFLQITKWIGMQPSLYLNLGPSFLQKYI